MKIKNGKMVEATVSELFENYLKCGYDDIMSFYDYKNQCEYFGLKITKEKENE